MENRRAVRGGARGEGTALIMRGDGCFGGDCLVGDFKPGDKLKTVDGTVSIVKSVEKDPENQKVYNFTTEKMHNYFVFSKDMNNRYLVHNVKGEVE